MKTVECDLDRTVEPFCHRYKNHGRIEEYLGDDDPSFFECLAVRITQRLNYCVSLDWAYESYIVCVVRSIGAGFRLAFVLLSLYVVVGLAMLRPDDGPLVFEYELAHPQPTMRFAEATVNVAFWLWVVDLFLLLGAHLLIRLDGPFAEACELAATTPFYRVVIREPKEVRAQRRWSVLDWGMCAYLVLLHVGCYFVGALAIHTLLGQMLNDRNVYLRTTFLVVLCTWAVSALDDLTQVGSPWGVQEASKRGAVILCTRACVIVPLTLVWSIAAVVACFPPSECREC